MLITCPLLYCRCIRQKCSNALRTFRRAISRSVVLYSDGNSNSPSDPFKMEKDKLDLTKFSVQYIRNFSIIAHVDHGKSTLADRLLEITGTIPSNVNNKQVLDKLPVERERGITVKAQSASLFYNYKGETYLLNLIDTPGHVDFNYEVTRSLAACQGVVLLVDANQGVQAQTVANFYLAFGANLIIIPALNKIDLKNSRPDAVIKQMQSLFEFAPESVLKISAKLSIGITELLERIIEEIPPPSGDINKHFKALVFDSWYDRYRGVIANLAIVDGQVKLGDEILSVHTGKMYEVKDLGILHPEETSTNQLRAGQVGYVVAGMKSIKEIEIGDTFCLQSNPVPALPGFALSKPMVFAGIFPLDQSLTPALRNAIEKLCLNDSSVSATLESSPALGQGWRLGFLGLLHMEVFSQRLDQEYDAQIIITSPSVPYKAKLSCPKHIKMYGKEEITINNPLLFPDAKIVSEYLEPMIIGTIIMPQIHLGKIMGLCMQRRGVQLDSRNMDESTIIAKFKLPLNEIIVDFFDELKTLSSGYASFDYEESGYEKTNLVKLIILLNGQEVEEFTTIVNAARARTVGQSLCTRLKEMLPPHQFQIAIQAAVGSKIIARENIKALRKDVTAKLHGGDITRRMKLLKSQTEGKKRLRMIGNITIPRDTFIRVLKKG